MFFTIENDTVCFLNTAISTDTLTNAVLDIATASDYALDHSESPLTYLYFVRYMKREAIETLCMLFPTCTKNTIRSTLKKLDAFPSASYIRTYTHGYTVIRELGNVLVKMLGTQGTSETANARRSRLEARAREICDYICATADAEATRLATSGIDEPETTYYTTLGNFLNAIPSLNSLEAASALMALADHALAEAQTNAFVAQFARDYDEI